MTRKDYIAIAETIGQSCLDKSSMAAILCDFSDMLKADNPRFKPDVFSRAVHAASLAKWGV